MKLSHKIKKLVSPTQGLNACLKVQRWVHAQLRSFPLTPLGLLADVNQEKLEEIRSRHSIANPGVHPEKYLEMEKWFTVNVKRVLAMGMDLESPKRVLDLGSGAGYFLHICKRLGHDVRGLDLNEPAWYGDITQLLGVPRVIWRINAYEPLPDLGKPFDLVTAFMICFNNHSSDAVWKKEQWAFFLDDLWTRLNPGAVVWLQLNPDSTGAYYTPELKQFFEERGAIVDRNRVVWGMSRMRYDALMPLSKSATF